MLMHTSVSVMTSKSKSTSHHCCEKAKPSHTLPPVCAVPQTGEDRAHVHVDGLNVICGNGGVPQLEALLTLVVHIVDRGFRPVCIFDANTRHKLREEQSVGHMEAYNYLRKEYRGIFIEVTGGTCADEIILAEADAESSTVVSQDSYRKYEEQYPWVKEEGRLRKFNIILNHLYISGQRLEIYDDLETAIADVERVLA